ncbi:MAG: oligosaccharide flippase family protein [Vicinamibacterales bacterium]
MKLLSQFVSPEIGPALRWSRRVTGKAAADVAGKLVALGVTLAAARTLPGDAFGALALATTWGWLAGVATDAGWSMYLVREVARRPAAARALAADVLRRRGLAAVGAAAITAAGATAVLAPAIAGGFALVVAAQLAGAVLDTAMHLFRGLERTDVEARLHAAQRLSAGALAGLALAWRPSLDALGLALALPPLVALACAAGLARRLTAPVGAGEAITPLGWSRVGTEVWPLGLGALVSALYFRCDVFFVEHWHGLDAVGAYNAAFRLVDAIRLVPAAVLAVTFPTLVRAHDRSAVTRLAVPLLAAGVAAGGALAVGAPAVLALAYGPRFAAATSALQLLGCAVPLFFLNYALTHQVIGWNGQRTYLQVSLAALAVNVVANLALVPAYGGSGAAVATGLTEVAVTAGCLPALARHVPVTAPAPGSAV